MIRATGTIVIGVLFVWACGGTATKPDSSRAPDADFERMADGGDLLPRADSVVDSHPDKEAVESGEVSTDAGDFKSELPEICRTHPDEASCYQCGCPDENQECVDYHDEGFWECAFTCEHLCENHSECGITPRTMDVDCDCGPCDDGNGCTEDLCWDESNPDFFNQCKFNPLTGPPCTLEGDKPGVCQNGACIWAAPGRAGLEFWAVDLDNAFVPGGPSGYYDAAGQQFAVAVCNPHAGTAASVGVHAHNQEQVDGAQVEPGSCHVFALPRKDADGTVIDDLAYRIKSTVPVTAYQFNPLSNVDVFSNDATVLYPTESLGQEYYVMTREQSFGELRSYATVVAVEPGETEVVVDVTAQTLAGVNVHTGLPIDALAPGQTLSVTLDQWDVLNIESDKIGADMTGTHILANRKIAVFGGSEASSAPNTGRCDLEKGVCQWDMETPCQKHNDCMIFNTCCGDHLEHQMPPANALGTHFQAIKTYPRGKEEDVYRVLAVNDDTVVTVAPQLIPQTVLNRGQWMEFESKEALRIDADKPVLVAQFIASADAPEPNTGGTAQPGDAGIGDPAMLLLIPVSQLAHSYSFYTPDTYELDYVSVVVPAKEGAPPAIWLDCPETDLQRMAQECDALSPEQFVAGPDDAFFAARLPIGHGAHRVQAEAPIAVYAYGYDAYVSYGFLAGSFLESF